MVCPVWTGFRATSRNVFARSSTDHRRTRPDSFRPSPLQLLACATFFLLVLRNPGRGPRPPSLHPLAICHSHACQTFIVPMARLTNVWAMEPIGTRGSHAPLWLFPGATMAPRCSCLEPGKGNLRGRVVAASTVRGSPCPLRSCWCALLVTAVPILDPIYSRLPEMVAATCLAGAHASLCLSRPGAHSLLKN